MSAVELLKTPQRLIRHQAAASCETTAFFVRSTAEEWECLQLAADQYGAPIGQFAADAIVSWLDPRIDIPRILQMPPLTNLKKRVHLDRAVVERIEQAHVRDVRGRPIQINKSDIGMSAILSFVQGVFDMRNGLYSRAFPKGCTISDAARPSMDVQVVKSDRV